MWAKMMPICHILCRNCLYVTKNCLLRGNVKTQFISILSIGGSYTAIVLNGNGDSDVHDDDQHTDNGEPAAGSADPDGDAER